MLTLLLLGAAPADRCASLRSVVVAGLEITGATTIGDACRVQAIARPRPNAAIGIEVWLPVAERWSGRYYQMGNGGFAGRFSAETLAAAAARGDVAAATDTGHKGDGFEAGWAQGRPDLIEDYAYRSIKVTADTAAALTRAYYGRPARRRYFMGCSFGGRQALVAASRWPADWDGVIAGAPAADWPARIAGFANIQANLRAAPGGWIAPDRIAYLAAIVRKSCRVGRDCTIAALRRACRAGRKAVCLTASQEASLREIEAAGYPLRDADPAEWGRWIVNPDVSAHTQLTFAVEGYRYVLSDNARWVIGDTPTARNDRVRFFAIGSLRPFAQRGGKILSYFGGADAVLPPAFAIADAKRLGANSAFYRLWLIPGMAHCQGGPSSAAFGQSIEATSAVDDSEHDIRRALEAWVERGFAPATLSTRTTDRGLKRTTAVTAVDFGN